ncbi:hypothetical protein AVEN_103908-1 [Araneus ventricosus]|uniref:Uncharacterized protein n=1 Tax=Araneus ventricosus TaxID=182803 RepID=A0A4Y2NKL4_ARAVE|nr:hypothetical protein AVEN_103908-1 [Araneus ventricosus]
MGKTDRAYNAKSAIHTFKQRPNMAAVYPCDWQLPIKIESGTKSMGKRVSLLKRRIQGFKTLAPRPILLRNFKILKSSSKRYVTSLSEQLTVKYNIRGSEFSAQQQLLITGTNSCSAPATVPQDPDGLPPTHPLSPTTAADNLIPRTEMIQHHQRTITGD